MLSCCRGLISSVACAEDDDLKPGVTDVMWAPLEVLVVLMMLTGVE